jgi:hypothetical protein
MPMSLYCPKRPYNRSLYQPKGNKRRQSYFDNMAPHIREYIKEQINNNKEYVSYVEVMDKFSIDRFTLASVLHSILIQDHNNDQPLFPSLMGTSLNNGNPSDGFWRCAKECGYSWQNKITFMELQRKFCKALITK